MRDFLSRSTSRTFSVIRSAPWLALAISLGFGIKLYIITTDRGMYVADEFAKSLEQGHRAAFGSGIIPWEFVRGAVTWIFPAAIGFIMQVTSFLGFNRPEQIIWSVQFILSLASLLTAYGTYRLARNLGAATLSAQFAGAIVAASGPILYFSHRALTEVASAPFVVFGFVYLTRKEQTRRDTITAASLFGIATLMRLQNFVFPIWTMVYLVMNLRARSARYWMFTLAGWIGILGIVDKLTWGHLFNSAKEYLAFNVFEHGGAAFGGAPATYYFTFGWRALGVLGVVLMLASLWSFKKTYLVTVGWLAFLAIHIAVIHKEARFTFVVLPLMAATASIGIDALNRLKISGTILTALLVSSLLYTTLLLPSYTWGTVSYIGRNQRETAWDSGGDVNRLLNAAFRKQDMCGIKSEILPWYSSGGYAQLHRNVPLYDWSGPTRNSGFYNYVITNDPQGGSVVARYKNAKLVKIANSCETDSQYTFRR